MFEALVEICGAEEAVRATRPHTKLGGMACASNARRRLGLNGNDLEAVAMPYYWVHAATSRGSQKELEIRDGGAVGEVYYCMLMNAPPEICVAISHCVAEGICEAINPDFEYVWTHHLTNGDGRCRYVIRRKSSRRPVEELGSLLKTVPRINLTEDEKAHLADEIFAEQWNVFTKASIEMNGREKTLEIVAPFCRESGKAMASILPSSPNNSRDAMDAAIDAVSRCRSALTQIGSTIRIKDVIEGETSSCPFESSPPEVCRQIELMLDSMCQVIDPTCSFSYQSMKTNGDNVCRWSIRTNRTAGGASSLQETCTEPFRVLALRLAKGEISEEEFDRKAALLRKHGL